MVRGKEKHTPEYDLGACQQAVAVGKYRLSRAAGNYIDDLAKMFPVSFSVMDLEKFVASLTPECFSKSVKYDNIDQWWDVYLADYRIRYTDEFGEPCEIPIKFYLKFYLRGDFYKVEIVSFHENR